MSKLDDILSDAYHEGVSDFRAPTGISSEPKKEIKALLLELIGEEVSLDGDAYGWHEAQNDLKAELHEKVEEL